MLAGYGEWARGKAFFIRQQASNNKHVTEAHRPRRRPRLRPGPRTSGLGSGRGAKKSSAISLHMGAWKFRCQTGRENSPNFAGGVAGSVACAATRMGAWRICSPVWEGKKRLILGAMFFGNIVEDWRAIPRRHSGCRLASGPPCKNQLPAGRVVSTCTVAVPGILRNDGDSACLRACALNDLCWTVGRQLNRFRDIP